MSIKNFIASLIFRNIAKDNLNKAVAKDQNDDKDNIESNNLKEIEAPKVANRNNSVVE